MGRPHPLLTYLTNHGDRRLEDGPRRDFEQYLIAYRPQRGGVAIERLVHAKQDYRRALK